MNVVSYTIWNDETLPLGWREYKMAQHFGKQFDNVDNPIWYNEAIPIQDMYPE